MSPATAILFPATDDNKHHERAKMLSDCPFSVYASRDIQRILAASGDACSNLLITRIEYYQRNAAPLHEYLVVSYKDTTASGVENYMLLERWGSDFTPSNNKTKPEEHIICTSVDQTHSPSVSATAIDLVLFSVEKYLETSDRLQSVANDRILISYRRMPADITHVERGQCTKLATLIPPPNSTFTVANMIVLSCCISDDIPVYDLLESQCFYFGRANWAVAAIAMGCKDDNIEAAPNASYMKSDPLQWLYQRVKNLMTEKVKGKYGSAAIKMKYDIAWEEFEASIRAQHAKNLLPLQKERLARQAAEAHAEVLESEYEQMKEAIARLQGEGLGAT